MKALSKYLQLLEKELEIKRQQIEQARKDVEFYRAKCERLELAIMSTAVAPAMQEYARADKPAIKEVKLRQQTPPHIPFSDLKRKWMSMTEEEQEKAINEGWQVEQPKEEESNAGI